MASPMTRAPLVTAVLLSTLGAACAGHNGHHGPGIPPAGGAVTVYIGTYTRGWACPPAATGAPCTSKGVYRASFDGTTGKLGEPVLAAETDNPSYLTVSADGKFLFAVNEVDDYQGGKSGAVSAFAIESSGALRLINRLSSHGADPCHLSIAGGGSTLLVANYSGGSVSSYRIGTDGALAEASSLPELGAHGPHKNQDAAHAHFIQEGPTAGLVYVADLGLDRVMLYDLDAATSKLTPHAAQPSVAVTPPGSGPRHLAIHPNRKFLYANNELGTTASVFARNPDTGALTTALQNLSTIPLPFGARADNGELQISRDGRFVYVSNRGHDSLTTFSVDEATGKLTLVENVPSGGKEPRDFKLDPGGRFLLVGHQTSDEVFVFAVDAATGKVRATGAPVRLSKPVNFAFWPPPR
jgi:6-phosphogluconolactonase